MMAKTKPTYNPVNRLPFYAMHVDKGHDLVMSFSSAINKSGIHKT